MSGDVLISARDVVRTYPVRRQGRRAVVRALDGVSLDIHAAETLGIVGESGCGKSTLGRILAGHERPTSGTVERRRAADGRRTGVQMVFQEPLGALNPRMRVGRAVGEAMLLNGVAARRDVAGRVEQVFVSVGLLPKHAQCYPHELSGGQQQRVGVARALACEPAVLIEDEPTSSLDVSVQAKLVNLLRRLQREAHIAQVFISHDLAVVGHLADRVAVMYLGRLVEMAPAAQLFAAPRHPYTAALLAATPGSDARDLDDHLVLEGDVPSPIDVHIGCAFAPRCPFAVDRCRTDAQVLRPTAGAAVVACWRATEEALDPLAASG